MTEAQMKDTLVGLRSELMKMIGEAAAEQDIVKIEHAQNGLTSIRNLSHVLGVALPDRAE